MKRCYHKTSLSQFRFTALFISVILIASGVFPAQALNKIASSNAPLVKVGYYENEVFQEGAEEGAVKTGYAYEYYRKLSEYTSWEYEYVYGSYTDLYEKLLSGEIDLLAGLAYKEEREGKILYPEAIMGSESYNLVKHSSETDITTDPSTLNGHTIGVLDGAMVDVLNKYLSEHGIDAKVKKYNDYDSLFADFDAKKLAVLAAEGDGAYSRNHAVVLGSFGSSKYYLCVSRKRPELLKQLNAAQSALEAEEPGYLETLNSKYYSVSIASRAYSEEEREWMNTHDSMTIGYLDNYLPYSDMNPDGEVTGMIRDYMKKLLSALEIKDCKLSYKGYTNYDEMVDDIARGRIDLAFPVGGDQYYSELNNTYQSKPVSSSTSSIVYRGSFSDEVTKHFAVNINNRMQYNNVKTNYPKAKITTYESSEECLDAVQKGEVSCTMLNGLRADSYIKNNKYSKLSFSQINVTESCCFGVSVGNEGLLRLINRGISSISQSYTQNLAYRYTSGLYTTSIWDIVKEHFLLFIIFVLAIAALIVFLLVRDTLRKKKQLLAIAAAQHELEIKNSELAQSKEALSDALAAAKHANRAKTTFLNNMSHDIRTPMNAIVGFTAMAATHLDNKEQVRDYLSKISISSRHLLSLINDVLDMSRIESGKMKIEPTDVHLPDMIHDLWTIVQSTVKSKQQELFIDTKDIVNEDIITDKLRLNQVLLNILTNATKFTPVGGTISFRVIEKPSQTQGMTEFEFRIKDNGIGMSEDFQKNIFDAFSREQTSTVSGIQGTGLGMAITKNIVDMMGGTISVTSVVNKGSEFVVNIPCRISENAKEYTALPELQGLRALVADDDADTCLSVCSMLRNIGMRPDWTNYGKEAVIRAKEAYEQGDKFRVYIIDWLMPDINGIETVRRIRKVIGDSDPIIILTAYDWTDIEEEAREAGVTGFCSKPLFMSDLRDVLSQPFNLKEEKSETVEEALSFEGKRLLVAEDNDLNRQIAVSILEGSGFTVEIAENGKEAVDMMDNNEAGYYDAVLMDIQMPVLNGYEAAKQIRALGDEQKAKIPIIAVTANAFEEDRRIALEAGMDGHLAKPYDIPVMLETLKNILY